MTNRVSLYDVVSQGHPSKLVSLIFFGVFLLLTGLITSYFFWKSAPLKSQTDQSKNIVISQIPLVLSGKYSPDKKYRAINEEAQLRIYDVSTNQIIFKLDQRRDIDSKKNVRTGIYFPQEWSQDSRSLVYKLQYSDSESFGLTSLNKQNIFYTDQKNISDPNCQKYIWSPDNKKIIFFKSKPEFVCVGSMLEIKANDQIVLKNYGNFNQKLGQAFTAIEDAFWDYDSQKVNLKINSGIYKTPFILDSQKSKTQTFSL